MQKIENISKWRYLEPETGIVFEEAQKVRLEVKTPIGTDWYLRIGDQNPCYLTTTSQSEVLSIGMPANSALIPMKPIRYYRREFDQEFSHRDERFEKFTEVAEPGARNRDMEIMINKAVQNKFKRQEALQRERERLWLEQQIAEGEVDAETGEINDTSGDSTTGDQPVSVKEPATSSETEKVDGTKPDTSTSEKGESGGSSDS
jgi:predicted transcriptional regulator